MLASPALCALALKKRKDGVMCATAASKKSQTRRHSLSPCFARCMQVGEEEQAPELTQRLFRLGGQLLLSHMPGVITGQAQKLAIPQDESLATHAPKVCCCF